MTRDPRDAIDISAAQLDFGTMSRAIDRMDERFEVSLEEIRSAAIGIAKKAIASPEEAVSVADACLLGWERGMSVESYDSALSLLGPAESRIIRTAVLRSDRDARLGAREVFRKPRRFPPIQSLR